MTHYWGLDTTREPGNMDARGAGNDAVRLFPCLGHALLQSRCGRDLLWNSWDGKCYCVCRCLDSRNMECKSLVVYISRRPQKAISDFQKSIIIRKFLFATLEEELSNSADSHKNLGFLCRRRGVSVRGEVPLASSATNSSWCVRRCYFSLSLGLLKWYAFLRFMISYKPNSSLFVFSFSPLLDISFIWLPINI